MNEHAPANEMDPSDDEEERPVEGQKMVYRLTEQEWEEHMRAHGVFRKWCPFCARGRCQSGAHHRSERSEDDLEQEHK